MSDEQIPFDKRVMLIVNPVSGRKQAVRVLPDIIRILMDSGYVVTTFVTNRRGDGIRFVEQFGGEHDLIVSVGGDGTFSEAVNGIVRSGLEVPVGLIPAGSTNDFASCHGISAQLLEAAETAARGTPRQIDVGRFNARYFTYIAAFGAFSWLSYTTPQVLKNTLGHSAYILDGLRDLTRLRPEHLRITTADRCLEGDFIFGAICNTTSVAGTFSLPKEIVQMDDGVLEVLLVHEPATILELQSQVASLRTQSYDNPLVELFHADKLTIETDGDVEWSLDGEQASGSQTIQIEGLKQRLTLMC